MLFNVKHGFLDRACQIIVEQDLGAQVPTRPDRWSTCFWELTVEGMMFLGRLRSSAVL